MDNVIYAEKLTKLKSIDKIPVREDFIGFYANNYLKKNNKIILDKNYPHKIKLISYR